MLYILIDMLWRRDKKQKILSWNSGTNQYKAKKELIKYKANKVALAELEALFLTHPAVADVALIPKPDEEAGEIPKPFVVLKPDQTLDADGLMVSVAENIAPVKKIRCRVQLQFPKNRVWKDPETRSCGTGTGKILKRVCCSSEDD